MCFQLVKVAEQQTVQMMVAAADLNIDGAHAAHEGLLHVFLQLVPSSPLLAQLLIGINQSSFEVTNDNTCLCPGNLLG